MLVVINYSNGGVMKSGIRTTEFWIALAGQIVPIFVIIGVLTAEDAVTINETVVEVVKAAFALLVSLGIIWKYIESRTRVKEANGAKE